jgi:hypothetical protein
MSNTTFVQFTRDHVYDAKDGRGGGLQPKGSILELEPGWPFYADCMQRVDERGRPLQDEAEVVASQASRALADAVAKSTKRLQPDEAAAPRR